MSIIKDAIYSNLIYSVPVRYTESLTLYPVLMEDILEFNMLKSCITVRKDSWFPVKKVIKMTYLEFLFFCHGNEEFAEEFDMPLLPSYYLFAYMLLKMVFKDQEVLANMENGGFKINGIEITDDQFDDIRRIIILQNGIDFDIDEFINRDTEEALLKAQEALNKGKDVSTLEDYIDSACLYMQVDESVIMKMPIRKFWRYVKRISKRDVYNTMKSAESTGMVSFKEPIQYWMTSIDETDKFENVKTNSESIHKMVSG